MTIQAAFPPQRRIFDRTIVGLLCALLLGSCSGEKTNKVAAQQAQPSDQVEDLRKRLIAAQEKIAKLESERATLIAATAGNPKLSEIFKTQLVQYLKVAGRLSAESDGGISLQTLRSQFAEVRSSFSLIERIWPNAFATDGRLAFEKSHEGYRLAAELWDILDNNWDGSTVPTEPNKNGWETYKAYAGEHLILSTYSGNTALVIAKKDNIGVLLALAAKHFEVGRDLVMANLN